MAFGPNVADLIAREDVDAYSLRLRELWGDRSHYRTDGIWDSKARYQLFRNNPEHRRFDPRPLHRSWMPLEIVVSLERAGSHSGFNLYHLGMLSPEDRNARHARYKMLDPESRFQAQGYDYLIDETGLQLATVAKERDFVPLLRSRSGRPIGCDNGLSGFPPRSDPTDMSHRNSSATILEVAAPQCVAEDFDGEIVVLNTDSGVHFSLRGTGASFGQI